MNGSLSWPTGLSWAVGAVLVCWMFTGLPGIVSIHGTDFEHYYQASQRLFQGENIYYDARADAAREGIDSWYLYPPYFAAGLYPLTWLGPVQAKMVFAFGAAAALIGIDLLLIRLRKIISSRAPLLDSFIHLLVLAPYPSSLLLGSLQIEGFLFLLFLLTVVGAAETRWLWGTGGAYVAGVMIKLWPGPYMLSLAAVWRKQIFIPILAIGLSGVILFTGVIGWRVQWTFLRTILPALLNYADAYVDNQSLSLFLRDLLAMRDGFIQLIRCLVGMTYVFAVYHARDLLKVRNSNAVFVNASLFATVSLLITPTAWTATHIRLLLPLVTAGALLANRLPCVPGWGYCAALSILFYIYPQGFLGSPPLYWLDRFPLLWATLIQYGVFLYLSFRRNRS